MKQIEVVMERKENDRKKKLTTISEQCKTYMQENVTSTIKKRSLTPKFTLNLIFGVKFSVFGTLTQHQILYHFVCK